MKALFNRSGEGTFWWQHHKHHKHHKLRIFFVLLFVSASLISAYFVAVHLAQSQADAKYGPTDGYGLYDSCVIDQPSCQNHLHVMADAGFRLILNYDQMYGSAAHQLAYARVAAAHGIKIIWALNEVSNGYSTDKDLRIQYKDLAATCKCSDNNGFIKYVINLVKDLPGTWGYYIADETPIAKHDQIKAFSTLVHQVDPQHPRLLVLGSDGPYVNTGIQAYADTAEVIAQDYYPIGDPNESINQTGTIAKQVQTIADKNGKQSGMVLQAHSLGQYSDYQNYCTNFPSCLSYPTRDQMTTMRNQALQASHPRVLLWYSYFDLVRSDNYNRHWNDLVSAMKAPAPLPQSSEPTTPVPTNQPVATPAPTQTPQADSNAQPTSTAQDTGKSDIHTIYRNGLQGSWLDWSWGSKTNLKDVAHPYNGKVALSWTPYTSYGGLYLHSPSGISTTGITNLTFAIRASNSKQVFAVSLLDGSGQPDQVLFLEKYGGAPTPGAYKVYTIPLSDLHATDTTIWGIEIINQTDSAQPPIYLDAIALQ